MKQHRENTLLNKGSNDSLFSVEPFQFMGIRETNDVFVGRS